MKDSKSKALKAKMESKKHSHKYKEGKCTCGEVEKEYEGDEE